MNLTAIVLTKNEEKNIKDCLKSLTWCEEMMVIDDYSEDKTAEIAESLGAKVYQRHLDNDFAAQRNFGLKKAKGDWVLFIDADERVSSKLRDEMHQYTSVLVWDGFKVPRQDWLGARQLRYGETARIRLLRLARKNAGQWQCRVHETWEIKGKVGELKNPILHYPHPTISEFLKKINFYSTLHARVLSEKGVKPSLFRLLANPLGKFFQNWLLRLGFLDGTAGLIVALMMSFHSFLARAKLYQLWKD